jgi:hypothetical protein
MAITPRGENIYLVRVYIGRDPVTRKRIEVNETVRGSYEDAERREQVLKENARKGQVVRSPRMTVNKLVDFYLETTRTHRSQTTQTSYMNVYRLYIRPYIGGMQITKVRPSDIQRLLNFLLDPRKE